MNRLTLAVAGGRKTQSIIDDCKTATKGERILLLTYTQANQGELQQRLRGNGFTAASVEVSGWFSFLLEYFVRPYLPLFLPGRRLAGLNFDGDPGIYAKGAQRYLDSESRAYKRHLAKLAYEVHQASRGDVMDRLSRMYDHIFIDEVQDLNGYDLEILKLLFDSSIDITMVGDTRQAILQTNIADRKNMQFRGCDIINWFKQHEQSGLIVVQHTTETWRCHADIAAFSDSLFPSSYGFPPTSSRNLRSTNHDGIHVLRPDQLENYLTAHKPMCIRWSRASRRNLDLPFVTFGTCKGLEADYVLIIPTSAMIDFITKGTQLASHAACSLYVGVTRARQGVAFLLEGGVTTSYPDWQPLNPLGSNVAPQIASDWRGSAG